MTTAATTRCGWTRIRAEAGAVAIAAVLLAGTPAGPAVAQDAAALRAQTYPPTDAINRQVLQAMRPKLQIRNGAGPISQLSLSADGKSLAFTSSDSVVRVWDLDNGRQTRQLVVGLAASVGALDVGTIPAKGSGKSRSATGAGLRVVATGGADGATLYDAVSGQVLRQFGDQGAVAAVRLSPDGSVLATAGSGGMIALWDTGTGRKITDLRRHPVAITALAFSGSGRLLASGGADGSVRLWDVPAALPLATLTGGAKVTALAFAGDDRVVAGDESGRVRAWTGAGAPAGSWSAESGPVTGLGVNRIGSVVTSAGTSEAHVWSASGGSLGRVSDPADRIALVAFSPDGTRVITAGNRGLVRVWNGPDGKFLAQLIATSGGWAVTDAGGRFDGSEGGIGNVSWTADQGTFDIANFSETYYEPGLLAKTLRAPGALITAAAPPVEEGVGVPPSVALTSAAGTVAAAAGATTVTVTATDQGAGIAQVRLFQNEKAVDLSRMASDSGGGRTRTVVFTVDLTGGTNVFRAVATSGERIEGQPASLTVRVAAPEPKPTLHLVAVGINQYANPQMTLNYAVADGKGFVDWAKKQVHPDFAKVEIHTLFDSAATRSAILEQFKALRNTPQEDVVVVYLAGRGENANGSWYFLPTEFGRTMTLAAVADEGVGTRAFEEGIRKMGASRVFLLIDACKLGSLGKAFAADADRKDLQLVSRNAGIHVLATTDKGPLAVELEQLGHGAFTYTVLQGLEGRAAADGVVRAKGALHYATDNVPVVAYKYTQMEQFPTVFSRGADFEVGRKTW